MKYAYLSISFFSIIGLIGLYTQHCDSIDLYKSGIVTTGTVVAVKDVGCGDFNCSSYTVKFLTTKGIEIETSYSLEPSYAKIGDKIKIVYNANYPYKAKIYDANENFWGFWLGIIFLTCLLSFSVWKIFRETKNAIRV